MTNNKCPLGPFHGTGSTHGGDNGDALCDFCDAPVNYYVVPDYGDLLYRIDCNMRTQQIIGDKAKIGSLEREAANLAFLVLMDCRAVVSPLASGGDVG